MLAIDRHVSDLDPIWREAIGGRRCPVPRR
jgi:hypothetical protein